MFAEYPLLARDGFLTTVHHMHFVQPVPLQERLNLDDPTFSDQFGGVLMNEEPIEATFARRDGYPFSGSLSINAYSAVVLSQNGYSMVIFRVECPHTVPGDQVYIVGSDEILGNWDIDDPHALALTTATPDAQFPWWQSTPVRVTLGYPLFFKVQFAMYMLVRSVLLLGCLGLLQIVFFPLDQKVVLKDLEGCIRWERHRNRRYTPERNPRDMEVLKIQSVLFE